MPLVNFELANGARQIIGVSLTSNFHYLPAMRGEVGRAIDSIFRFRMLFNYEVWQNFVGGQ